MLPFAEIMHEFEDFEDPLQNPEAVVHSLPPYTQTRFFEEYPKTCVITAALLTVVASMYFWKLLRMRREGVIHSCISLK